MYDTDNLLVIYDVSFQYNFSVSIYRYKIIFEELGLKTAQVYLINKTLKYILNRNQNQ